VAFEPMYSGRNVLMF